MCNLFCGIDLGTRSSAICVIDRKKQTVLRWQGSTQSVSKTLSKLRRKIHCVIEAGPFAESVCERVEACGKSIEIIDSRHTKALLHGKKKTDKIDAQVLAELALMGWYKPIYRKGGKAREQRTVISARATLVNTCTQIKNTIRGLLKASGIVLPCGGEGEVFAEAVRKAMKELPCEMKRSIEDLLSVWLQSHELQKSAYKNLAKIAKRDAVISRLMTVPGVGPATALAFASTIVTPTRFPSAKQVSGYLGLAPKVHKSGELNYHGRVTKKGDKLTRWLLVEAANVLLTRVKTDYPLQQWGLKLAEKKGFAKAKVAVARRLAELLYTLWITETDFKLKSA